MSTHSLAFALFVVVTGILFVRPTELVSVLNGAPLYEAAIIACLFVSWPLVAQQLTARSLRARPTTFCVLGLLAAVALSLLSHMAVVEAVERTWLFFRLVLPYLMLVAVVNTPARLRHYLGWLAVFILVLTTLALLQHHEVINHPALAGPPDRVVDEATGDVQLAKGRLCGAGIFNNPNDLSRILVVGIAVSLYFLDGRRSLLTGPFWVVAIGLFGYALVLTQSRGGLIALFVTLVVLFHARFGTRRTLLLAAVVLPALGMVFGGRQTDLSTSEGTGQQRIRLWSDGLVVLGSSPLFGIGLRNYPELVGNGLGAHNSFVEMYVELGFFGGTLFLAAEFCALWMCARMGGRSRPGADPGLRRLRPYLLAILAGYAAGMLSSSRGCAAPTYLLLGLVVIYLRLARADLLLPSFRVSTRLALKLTALSAVVLAAIQLYVTATVHFGSKI